MKPFRSKTIKLSFQKRNFDQRKLKDISSDKLSFQKRNLDQRKPKDISSDKLSFQKRNLDQRKPKDIFIAIFTIVLIISYVIPCNSGSESGIGDLLTQETERAISRGLRYLAVIQSSNGSWGEKYEVAITALSLMAFMARGYLPGRPPYGEKLDDAIGFLVERSKIKDGYMGVSMYEHALATLALSEAWGMSNRKEIRGAIKRAVNVILRAQSPVGGWRYQPLPIDADISVTVMQIVALASAKEAGIYVPSQVIEKAIVYVKSLQHKPSGGFGYRTPSEPKFGRTAAGVMSLMLCGEHNSEAVKKGLNYLMKQAHIRDPDHHFYGHYYAVQAMFHAGEKYFRQWYPLVRDSLISEQRRNGSWPKRQDKGYSTAMAILILAVPYQYLPIFQR
jgi:hypothetical protein